MIAGLDEAGRGPVIGPLVIAGVACPGEDESWLKGLGARDSKLLSARRREDVYREIISEFRVEVVRFQPPEVDRALKHRVSLNQVEAKGFARVINQLCPEKAILDCVGRKPRVFSNLVRRGLKVECSLKVEHRADLNYPIVGAASIVAKVERDREIEKLKEKYGEMGSGYASDVATRDFLEKWMEEHDCLPSFVRTSWKTAKRFCSQEKELKDFF